MGSQIFVRCQIIMIQNLQIIFIIAFYHMIYLTFHLFIYFNALLLKEIIILILILIIINEILSCYYDNAIQLVFKHQIIM